MMGLSNILAHDILIDIVNKLSLSQNIKLSHVNPFFYELCQNNRIWKKYYDNLFDRMYISDKSIHTGPVTYWNCKCGYWPGYSELHTELDVKCKNKKHYVNLEKKVPKAKNVDYKKLFVKKYITLVRKDKMMSRETQFINEKQKLTCYKDEIDKQLQECNDTLDMYDYIHRFM